jgi:hypothetical protein
MTEAPTAHPGDQTGATCAACPHPESAHDEIGLRYCAATVAGGWHRGCVCPR